MEDLSVNKPLEKQESDSGLNFKWFVSTLLGVWPWFLISIIVALSIGQLYLRYTTPMYATTTEIILNDTKKSGVDNSILEGLGFNSGKFIMDNELRVLKSRTIMTKVVKELGLNIRYLVSGRLKTTELYGNSRPFIFTILSPEVDSLNGYHNFKVKKLTTLGYTFLDEGKEVKHNFGDTINCSMGTVVISKIPGAEIISDEYAVLVSPAEDVAGKYAGALTITIPNKQSTIFTISTSDEISQRAADVINKLVDVYMNVNIADRNRITDNTIAFIEDRLKDVSKDLNGVEGSIESFKKSNDLVDIHTNTAYLLTNSNESEQVLRSKTVELNILKNVEKYINDKKGVPGSIIAEDPTVKANLERLNSLVLEKNRLLLSNTENNPGVKTLNMSIDNARSDLLSSITSKKATIQYEIDELKKRNSKLDADIRSVPAKERVYLEYSRQQAIKQDLYLFLLKKREEAAITKSTTVANVKIIDPAKPGWLISPNRSKTIYISFLCGLLIPGLGLYLRRAMNTRIISKLDISKQTNTPILGEIGHYQEEHPVAVKTNSRSVLAEQFRGLRTNLQFMFTDKNEKVILLTSTMSGEGKSFIAINLACTFAISGKKVVILEMDLRKPKISSNLGIDNSIGFSTYAIGNNTLDDIIRPSEIVDNFYVISSGPIPPNPSELIMLQRTEDMFNELREKFDYIIIDTAPLGLVTDAQLLAKHSDASLYVVRQAYTFKQQIQIPNDLYVQGKLPKMSIIVNDVRMNLGFLYGYGYGYNYTYGYGYGYGGYGYGGYGYGSYGAYGNGYYQENTRKKGVKKLLGRIRK